MRKAINICLLLLTSVIWGLAFVAQKWGMDSIQPFWLNAIRMTLGGVALLPFWIFSRKKQVIPQGDTKEAFQKRSLVIGLILGVVLFGASSLQNFGIKGSGAGKSGFITSLYIVIVPLMSLFLHEKAKLNVWISIVLSLVGLYLLCFKGNVSGINGSDILLVLCAIVYSIQIILVGRYSNRTNVFELSSLQLLISGFLSLVFALIFETITMENLKDGILAILYLGLLSSAGGYTLQMIGQKGINSTVASLLMSLESVFSVVFGVIILKEVFEVKEVIGCILIFLAVILAQIPFQRKKKELKPESLE